MHGKYVSLGDVYMHLLPVISIKYLKLKLEENYVLAISFFIYKWNHIIFTSEIIVSVVSKVFFSYFASIFDNNEVSTKK